jgi:hypothetical protein
VLTRTAIGGRFCLILVDNLSRYFKRLVGDRDGWNGLALQHVWFFGPAAPSVRLKSSSTDGGRKVDLALRLNVLAVCAAIVFVGAILLGAF